MNDFGNALQSAYFDGYDDGYKDGKRDVAKAIFGDIYEDCFDQFGYINYEALAELKKKYMDEEEG